MATRVKICGITTWDDARLSIDLGASALGFNFYPPSQRAVSPADAWSIVRRLPPFVEAVGVPQSFCDLAWSQAVAEVRGETSQDSYENRRRAIDRGRNEGPGSRMAERTFSRLEQPVADRIVEKSRIDERAKSSFFESAFSDALAIYMLSLTLDFNYTDLREREYPLLAPAALAERLRHVAQLFPPNRGYEFAVLYRRKA